MSRPFGAALLERDEVAAGRQSLVNADLVFARAIGAIPEGVGDDLDDQAAPFARIVAKKSFPVTGAGAATVASFVTDTATHSSGVTDDNAIDDR
jgi:hypothetical protein